MQSGKTPIVSVVIPAHNAENTLAESLDSVLKQSFPQIEVVVVDDGSEDNTRGVVECFRRKDKRIRYVYQPRAGVSAARNRGILEARGKYISFLDADDLYEARKLEVQLAMIQGQRCDVVLTSVKRFIVNEKGYKEYLETSKPPRYTDKKQYLMQVLNLDSFHMVVWNTAIVPRPLLLKIGGYDERLKTAEDWDIWLRFAKDGYRFERIQNPLFLYRKSNLSVTVMMDPVKTLATHIYVLNKLRSSEAVSKREISLAKASRYCEFIGFFINREEYKWALKLMVTGYLQTGSHFIGCFLKRFPELLKGILTAKH